MTALATVFLASIAGAAFAGDTPASSTPAAVAPAHAAKKVKVESPDDVICRTEMETGSRLNSHRTCLTRQQWNDQSTAARNALGGGHPDGVTPGR
jgi:hypothetical protein